MGITEYLRATRFHTRAFRCAVLALSLSVGACSRTAPVNDVEAVVAAARRTIGWPNGDGPTLRMHAAVSSSGPSFRVELISAPSGSVRLQFDSGALLAMTADSSVALLGPEGPRLINDTLETFLRGHDLLLMLVQPRSRIRSVEAAGPAMFNNIPAVMLTGRDALDAEVRLYYAKSDSLPLGYEVLDHLRGKGMVRVALGAWSPVESTSPLRHPREVHFTQGLDTFRYAIEWVEQLDAVADDLFLRRVP